VDEISRERLDDQVAAAGQPEGASGQPHPAPDLSAAVYGTLLVTSLVAVQARSDSSPEFVVFSVLIGVGVFWLADVWTGLVALRMRGPISWSEVRSVARVESPMLTAALLPGAIVALGILRAVPVQAALDLALVVCIAQLFVWGLAVGRRLERGWPVALLVAGVDCLLGLVIVVLKVLVLH
jgi:hypothetical protein